MQKCGRITDTKSSHGINYVHTFHVRDPREKSIAMAKNESPSVRCQQLRRRRTGYAIFSSLVELLLIALLLCAVIIVVPFLIRLSRNALTEKTVNASEPLLRLTRTDDDRIW